MSRRAVLLTVAVLIAALGAVLVLTYVKGIETRATQDQELVNVLAATQHIETGERLDRAQQAGKVEVVSVRRADLVPGALKEVGSHGGDAANHPIHPGQQLLGSMFGAAAPLSGLDLRPGQVALSVALNDDQRVAGFVTPGSKVALYVSTDVPGKSIADKPISYTGLLMPEVVVLGVGQTTKPAEKDKSTEAANEKVVFTLAVEAKAAQKVIFAARNTQVTFGLLGVQTHVKGDRGVVLRDVIPHAFGGAR